MCVQIKKRKKDEIRKSYLSVKYICVVVDVVGQQVGLGAHQQRVPGGVWSQPSCGQAGHRLVDVEEGDVRVLGALAQPVSRGPLSASVRVVDENLCLKNRDSVTVKEKKIFYITLKYLPIFQSLLH